MRRVIIALAATIAALISSATPSNAAPSATLASPTADDGLVQKVQIFRAVITGNIPMALLPSLGCRPLSPSCRPW